MPPESATWTALRNGMSPEDLARQAETGEPEKGRWSQMEQLIAVVADRVASLEYVLICANTDKKSKLPDPPVPIRRPGAAPKRAKAKLSKGSANTLFDLLNGGAA